MKRFLISKLLMFEFEQPRRKNELKEKEKIGQISNRKPAKYSMCEWMLSCRDKKRKAEASKKIDRYLDIVKLIRSLMISEVMFKTIFTKREQYLVKN